ncbi:MAG: hypothetical protein ACI310_06005 [Bacilli bacterium]
MNNKNIQIKCYIVNCLNIIPCKILIYNSKNNLVCKGITNEFNFFKFYPSECGIYKIIVEPTKHKIYPFKICKFYYFNGNNSILQFIFSTSLPKKEHHITFNLTDKNYKNLPVEKGVIKTWNI